MPNASLSGTTAVPLKTRVARVALIVLTTTISSVQVKADVCVSAVDARQRYNSLDPGMSWRMITGQKFRANPQSKTDLLKVDL